MHTVHVREYESSSTTLVVSRGRLTYKRNIIVLYAYSSTLECAYSIREYKSYVVLLEYSSMICTQYYLLLAGVYELLRVLLLLFEEPANC